MMRMVYRPHRMKDGKKAFSRLYRLVYQLPGMGKRKSVSLGTTDKQVAEKKADEFLRELQQEAAGIIAPRIQRESAHRNLTDHIEDYIRDLRASGRDSGYLQTLELRLNKLMRECGWKVLRDVTADSFQNWRSRQELAAKTLKQYFDTVNSLMKWLQRNGRASANPMEGVTRTKTRGKEARLRRAFTAEEVERLLAVAGPRRLGYLTAIYTGLRRGELTALEWGDVHLETTPPFLSVRASTTKNSRQAAISLHPALAQALRDSRPVEVEAGDLVFSKETLASMYWMRRDLASARISFVDAQGRRADFHALRGSLNTLLALANIDPQTRQSVMRHSEIGLTTNVYMDKMQLPVTQAIYALPDFAAGRGASAAARVEKDATIDATELDISCPGVSFDGTNDLEAEEAGSLINRGFWRGLAQRVAEGRGHENGCLTRTRT